MIDRFWRDPASRLRFGGEVKQQLGVESVDFGAARGRVRR
jgi:hypothetical protein